MKKSFSVLGLLLVVSMHVSAAGRVLSSDEASKVMPLTCSYLKKAYENTRYQIDMSKCIKSKIYINIKDPNYGTYVYGDYKVDSINKVNCSIQLSDDLKIVKLADCSDG